MVTGGFSRGSELGAGTASTVGAVEVLTALQNIVKALNGNTAVMTRSGQLAFRGASASTQGMPVKIATTASPGTLFHTASPNEIDQIWLYLSNTSAAPRRVTLQFGDEDADHEVTFTVPSGETIKALDGAILSQGLTIRAYAAAADVVRMFGWVIRR